MEDKQADARCHYDVAVIGAGPAGTVAAIAAARQNQRVLLIEANPNAASRFAGEWLHPPGVSVLDELGLLPLNADGAHGGGRGMVVFPDDGDEPIRLPYPNGATGLSFDHLAMVETLRERARATAGIDYLPFVRTLAIDDGRLTLCHRTGEKFEVSAERIIGAEGRNSISRTHLGLSNSTEPLSHMAGVELRGVELPFEGYGHVILGGPGPILLYRIGPGRARACLDIPIDRCPRRRDVPLLWRSFRSVLPASLVPAFRDALLEGRVMWTTTRFRPRSHYGRDKLALVGDAVGFFHPMTAAGLTLGFHDAALLATSSNVEEYRQQRERQSYVAELLSMSLYRVMSGEDASTESIRTAVYRMWGDSEMERARTMRMLISEDFRSVSFAAAFLKVGLGALKHLLLGHLQGERRGPLPTLASTLSVPRTLLQWPAALLIRGLTRAPFQLWSTTRSSGRHLRLVEPQADRQTSRPSEVDVRVALTSAFGALSDSLESALPNDPGRRQAAAAHDLPRVVEALLDVPPLVEDGPSRSAALLVRRRKLAGRSVPPIQVAADDVMPWRAEATLALLRNAEQQYDPTQDLALLAQALVDGQRADGEFSRHGNSRSARWFARMRNTPDADVATTALCCRALSAVRKHDSTLLIEHIPLSIARARTWLTERQTAAGYWNSADGRPCVRRTALALRALHDSGSPATARPLRRAGRWLCEQQADDGDWCGDGAPVPRLTAHVVTALIAARPLEVDTIERGVIALLDPTGWVASAGTTTRDLCAIVESLSAFLEWSRDVPSARPARLEA